MAETIATGQKAWRMLKHIKHLYPAQVDFLGQMKATIQPMTKFLNLVYITNTGSTVVYIQDDKLKQGKPNAGFRNAGTLAGMARAGATAAWTIPVYRVMVYFVIAIIPGGRQVAGGVKAINIAAFFSSHHKEIYAGLKEFRKMIKALQEIYVRCPKLGRAMLSVALQQSYGTTIRQIKKQGFVKFIAKNLDWKKSAEEAARLFGTLLRVMFGRSHRVAGFLAKRGLVQLAKVCDALIKTYRLVRIGQRAKKAGPGVKDKQVLVAAFIKVFGNAGVRLTKQQATEIAKENCLNDPGLLKKLDRLQKASNAVEKIVSKLTRAAEKEIF